MNRTRWAVALVIVFHLGVGVGLAAGRYLRVEDAKQACIRAFEGQLPRLEWRQ